jgi:thioredoxin-related protein
MNIIGFLAKSQPDICQSQNEKIDNQHIIQQYTGNNKEQRKFTVFNFFLPEIITYCQPLKAKIEQQDQ